MNCPPGSLEMALCILLLQPWGAPSSKTALTGSRRSALNWYTGRGGHVRRNQLLVENWVSKKMKASAASFRADLIFSSEN